MRVRAERARDRAATKKTLAPSEPGRPLGSLSAHARGYHAPTTTRHPHSLCLNPNHTSQALPLVSTVQDAIVGGAVAAALGVAAWAGAKGDPETCALCAGTGGCGCFACSSSGVVNVVKEASTSDAAPPRPVRRDLLGRVPPPPGQCRVCGGTGLVLCSGCRGSGYRKL